VLCHYRLPDVIDIGQNRSHILRIVKHNARYDDFQTFHKVSKKVFVCYILLRLVTSLIDIFLCQIGVFFNVSEALPGQSIFQSPRAGTIKKSSQNRRLATEILQWLNDRKMLLHSLVTRLDTRIHY